MGTETTPVKRTFWEGLKHWVWKYIGGLFMDEKAPGKWAMSLGRVAFLAVLGQMMWKWYKFEGEGLPPGMMEVFYTLAVYVFGTKITDIFNAKVKGNGAAPTLPVPETTPEPPPAPPVPPSAIPSP